MSSYAHDTLCICIFFQVPIVPNHVHSINDSVSAEQAAKDYEFVIRQLVKTRVISVSETSDCPKFDLVLLGMGPDGHVASLFPNHSVLNEKDEWVTFITDSPKPPPERNHFHYACHQLGLRCGSGRYRNRQGQGCTLGNQQCGAQLSVIAS
ncbi:6-phosphogluconolactonase 1 [Actinidia rufa]|uniref:6-phosphogluconolactonase 1 n=1 Tax=Actinidia rufa TaxID=165716 RepID=A0A7J0FIB9_9ERIC|nr:6-phosphogluconolactonase 1 [Actinidia rufa]